MKMKLKETISLDVDEYSIYNGVIKSLWNDSYHNGIAFLEELNENDINGLEFDYYYGRSGEKELSILASRMFELYGDDIAFSERMAGIIALKYKDSWNRTYSALMEEYNPLHNYNMTENEKITDNETLTGSVHNEQNSLIENVNSKQGFNSNDFVNDTRNVESGTTDNNYQNEESNSTKNTTNTREHTRSGNIGVTTTQKMLNEELEVRKNIFIDMVMRDIDKIMCSKVYKF